MSAENQLSQGKDPKFLVGVAISVFQNSGDENSNWAWFEKQKVTEARVRLRLSTGKLSDPADTTNENALTSKVMWKGLGPSTIKNGYRIGKASDFWNRYEQDIQLSKDLGCNSFRFSIEWSRIEPHRGQINEDAIKRYHEIFDCLERYGMEPNVTLHWFAHPLWFSDIKAFGREENIPVFVDWCKLAFHHFGKRSKLWSTFNEPTVAAMCGFITGNHPPGKVLQFREAGKYLLNIMRSHAAAYKAIKAMPGGQDVQVGIVHNVWWTEPKGRGPLYSHVRAACGFANRVWANTPVMSYLKEGVYDYWVPVGKRVKFTDPAGKPGCDFFGINHYCRGVIDWTLTPTFKGGAGLADMGYPIYPPSLYRAISYASTLGLPIYVMENGLPAAQDDNKREMWINGALSMVSRAVEDGYDVRGYMYWTLVDNFEWNFAWQLKFGLYEWNPDGTQERKLREGAKCIKEWYARLPDELGHKLAQRRRLGDVKPEAERQRLEKAAEVDWLLNEGGKEEKDLHKYLAQDDNPVVVGVC